MNRVSHISLVVKDLKLAQAFYDGFLGLAPLDSLDPQVEGANYRCGDLVIHLLVAEEHPRPSRRHVAFEVSSFDRVLGMLDAQRVHIAGGPGEQEHNGCRFVYCHDPDGNLVEITTPATPG